MPASISVVMPYYKNERTLRACLQSFANQKVATAEEIIVVDDGGPARAADICQGLALSVPLTILRTQRAGQSGATNAGIAAAHGDIIMLTCADIIASPQLLQTHLQAHAQDTNRAVLGYLPYASSVKMTPFMQFLRTSSLQFDYGSIENIDDVNCLSLYAPNVSVRAHHLRRVGGFDAAFEYGYQDTDLGIRLRAIGVRLAYRAKAIGYHDHPNDFLSFAARQERIGEAAIRMLQLHRKREFDEVFISGAEYALPRLKLYSALLADAQRIEAAVMSRPALLRGLRQNLFRLYSLVLLLAVYRGALRKRAEFPLALRGRVSTLLDDAVEPAHLHHAAPDVSAGQLGA